jgi:peptide/nickel transport system substrate-binding protein
MVAVRKFRLVFFVTLLLLAFGAVAGTAQDSQYSEAPMLAAMVEAGTLPPVEERLPVNPLVFEGAQTGVYGGNWRMGMRGADYNLLFKTFGVDNLVTWSPDGQDVVPNLAERFEVSEDGTEFTFTLREGLKWSDGQPYTTDDIEFWWTEVAQNTDLEPGGFPSIQPGGVFGEFTKIDDTTFTIRFEQPYVFFLQQLSAPQGAYVSSCPAHVAKLYHANYVPEDELAQMVADGGFTTWVDLFNARMGTHCQSVWSDEERPTMYAWVIDEGFSPNATQLNFTRNPYYWKVDGAGNQYPYIDTLTVDVVQDVSALVLMVTNGEIDYQARTFNTDDNKPVIFDNQETGNYRLISLQRGLSNTMAIHFNMTSRDPEKRAIFQSHDFRQAMSLAINRPEIIDTIFVSQGSPAQPAPLEITAVYNEQLATQFTDYDVEQATALLDAMGMTVGADGFRTTPDGQPFSFVLEGTTELTPYTTDVGLMLVGYWQAIGINVEYRDIARDLFTSRKDNNDTDATLWIGEGGLNPLLDPRNFAPVHYESNWGVAWRDWFNNPEGETAEEPPADVMAIIDAYRTALAAPSLEAQRTAVEEMLQLSADFFPVLGISTPTDGFGVANNLLMNVPDRMITDFTYTDPFIARPFAWFFAQ